MAANPDHYRTLGVHPSSEDFVIQAAYRALMRRYHPDTNRDPDAIAKAQAINAAYAILSDPVKRREYDEQQAARRRSSQKPPTPPPPPPEEEPAPATARHAAAVPMKNGPGPFLAFGGIVAVCILIVIGANMPSAGAVENTMNVDETLTTENLFEDYGLMDSTTGADANLVTDGITMDANAMTPVRPTLQTAPAESIEFDNLEAAARRFASILLSDGMTGARNYSTECHRKVVESPTWRGADYCAAFDFAAAYVDRQISSEAGWPANSYFRFQSDNQQENYVEAGSVRFTPFPRLTAIKQAVEPAAAEAVQVAIERKNQRDREEAARNAETALTPEEKANARSLQEQREAQY